MMNTTNLKLIREETLYACDQFQEDPGVLFQPH